MSLGELLRTKSSEYELLAEWHAEHAPLDHEHFVVCQAMAVVGIVLREVAEAIQECGETDGVETPSSPVGEAAHDPARNVDRKAGPVDESRGPRRSNAIATVVRQRR